MKWLLQAFGELKSALGVRRYVIGGIATVVATILSFLYPHITGTQINPFLSVALVSLFVLLFIFVCLLDRAVQMRRTITPVINIECAPLVQSPMYIQQVAGGQPNVLTETSSVWVRGKVTVSGKLAARECNAVLIDLHRRRDDTDDWESVNFQDALELRWANVSGNPFNALSIPVGVRRYFDIFFCRTDTNEITLPGPWPSELRDVFKERATYRFKVGVTSEGVTKTISILVKWTGRCNELEAIEDPAL